MSEPHYTGTEKARLAALVARTVVAVQRGKSTARIDRTIDRIREGAELREALIERKVTERETARRMAKAERQANRRAR